MLELTPACVLETPQVRIRKIAPDRNAEPAVPR